MNFSKDMITKIYEAADTKKDYPTYLPIGTKTMREAIADTH